MDMQGNTFNFHSDSIHLLERNLSAMSNNKESNDVMSKISLKAQIDQDIRSMLLLLHNVMWTYLLIGG